MYTVSLVCKYKESTGRNTGALAIFNKKTDVEI